MGNKNAKEQIFTIKSILELDPLDLADYLIENYFIPIPPTISNAEDLSFAGDALKQIGVTLQFFHELSAYAKRYVHIAKRELPKNEYEDMIDRKEIIAEITNALTELKNGLSRNVTTYTRGLDEMHLL